MPHTAQKAKEWLALFCAQNLPQKDLLLEHVRRAKIGELCKCGCNSFLLTIDGGVVLKPLQTSNGLFCEVSFKTNHSDDLTMRALTDQRGYLSGLDVTFGPSNHGPIPESIKVLCCGGIWPSVPNERK